MRTPEPGVFKYKNQDLFPATININFSGDGGRIELFNTGDKLTIKIKDVDIDDEVRNNLCIVLLDYNDVSDKHKASSSQDCFIDKFAAARIEQARKWLPTDDASTNSLCPVIFITDYNMLSYLPHNGMRQEKSLHKDFVNNTLRTDKRINFLDGSVWHRLTSIETMINTQGDSLIEIIRYYMRIYKLNKDFFNIPSTIEYLDLSSRMQLENYLMRTKDGGHSTFVTPFISHSETRMHHNITKILLDKNNRNAIFQTLQSIEKKSVELQWKLLIIDDKVKQLPEEDISKKKIIIQWLNEIGTCDEIIDDAIVDNGTSLFTNQRNSGDQVGAIYRHKIKFQHSSVDKIDDAVAHVADSKGSHDIILLDYLLGRTYVGIGKRDYGHRFIKFINDLFKIELDKNDQERLENIFRTYHLDKINAANANTDVEDSHPSKKKYTQDEMYEMLTTFSASKAPFDRFWIFPLSVHNTALLETLKEEGIQFNNPNWYISRGGDPINTPYLFLYNLLNLMEYQVREAYLDENELKLHLNEFIDSISTDERWDAITSKARAAVNRFMHRFGTFEMLDSDEEKGSLLAKSLKDCNNHKNIFLYNTIRNFLYLLGYRSYKNILELLNSGETINTALYKSKENLEVRKKVHELLEKIRKAFAKNNNDS